MPDEFLTIEQVAQRLALPPEMIRRRIESGDIPVHWVEADGKLEMRVAQDDIVSSGTQAQGFGAAPQFPTPYGIEAPQGPEAAQVGGDDASAEVWGRAGEAEAPQGLWTPTEQTAPPETSPWDAGSEELSAMEPENAAVPVWRPDPATWEDEPLEEGEQGFVADPSDAPSLSLMPPEEPPESRETGVPIEHHYQAFEPAAEAFTAAPPAVSGFPSSAEEPESESSFGDEALEVASEPPHYVAPPAPGFGFSGSSMYEEEESADSSEEITFTETSETAVEEPQQAAPTRDDVAPPSALVTASGAGAGALAINSIDARELVAGLFERWERALEQRIQAEQRLRFEAELEQRMRQVRDLRQELDQSRQAQATELAEREREMMELRNRVRELEQAPRSRSLFRR
ncbi:MAG: OmpH/Skp family outer membrane protein [Candidatus Dormibacteria bacterium]